jgi:tetratricopeptide (TPR) repeat protein
MNLVFEKTDVGISSEEVESILGNMFFSNHLDRNDTTSNISISKKGLDYVVGVYNELPITLKEEIEGYRKNWDALTEKEFGDYVHEHYANYIKDRSHNSELWEMKGNHFCNFKDYDSAISCFDKSLEINPSVSEAWNNKGVALLMLGIYEEAITCFDKAILLNPTQRDTALVNRNLAVEKKKSNTVTTISSNSTYKDRDANTNEVKLNLRIRK